MSKTLFKLRGARKDGQFNLSEFQDHLDPIMTQSHYHEPTITTGVLSMESSTPNVISTLTNTAENFRSVIEQAFTDSNLSLEDSSVITAIETGVVAGMMTASPADFARSGLSPFTGSYDRIALQSAGRATMRPQEISMESYNEQEFREVQRNTILFNLVSVQQDELGRLWFPPVLLAPGQSGAEVTMFLTLVHNDFQRTTSGDLSALGRKNVLRGFVDPEVLETELTTLYPVFRKDGPGANAKYLADPAIVPPELISVGGGVEFETTSILIDTKVELLGISQTNETLNIGVRDSTSTISPAARLSRLDIQFGDDVYAVNTYDLPYSSFVGSLQGDTRDINLNFDTRSIIIRAGSKTVKGEDPTTNAVFKDYNLLLATSVNGKITLDTGVTRLAASELELVAATDVDNNPVDDATFAELAKAVAEGSVYSYRVEAYAENLELRENGHLIESKSYRVIIPVPYLSPITSLSSTYHDEADLPIQLNDLIATNGIRANNRGVKRILDAADSLRNYVAILDEDGNVPELEAIATPYVLPAWHSEVVRFSDILDGTRSAHKPEDIQRALLNKFHIVAMTLLQRSEYLVAGRMLTGDQNFKPTLIVATDPTIASLLNVEIENGIGVKYKEFDIEIAATPNKDMVGKAFISFAYTKAGQASTELDVLTFGNFLYRSEMVSNVVKSRNGGTSRARTVTPSFLHTWNLPVLGEFIFEDLPEVTNKYVYSVDVK